MSKLNLSENGIITQQAGKALADMLKANSVLTELNISNCADYTGDSNGPGFAQELAVGISGNGTLTSLNLSSNNLEAEGAKIVAEVIKVNGYAIAVILAPFSCPSDHWMNCCCLLLSTGHGGVDEPAYRAEPHPR
jgi:hypothetical protein